MWEVKQAARGDEVSLYPGFVLYSLGFVTAHGDTIDWPARQRERERKRDVSVPLTLLGRLCCFE